MSFYSQHHLFIIAESFKKEIFIQKIKDPFLDSGRFILMGFDFNFRSKNTSSTEK